MVYRKFVVVIFFNAGYSYNTYPITVCNKNGRDRRRILLFIIYGDETNFR